MNVEEYEALRAQEDQEELARLREQYSAWLEPHEVYCFINATPADFLTWLSYFRQRVLPKFPQDPTVATWGGLGIDSYPTCGRPGGSAEETRGKPVDGHMWRCVPLPYGAAEPEPGTLPVSTVWLEAWAVTAAPARSRVELRLVGPHLGRWYEALQAFVLENYPEAGAWRRVHPATAGSTSSTTPPEPPSGERAATGGSPPGEPAEAEKRGMKVGTADRVKEAHRQLKLRNASRHTIFKRVHIDPRTYDTWCKQVTGEDPVEPYLVE